MTTATRVSIDEYLQTSYHPDVEYLDGELKQKPVVTLAHGEVQAFLSVWFYEHRKEWVIRFAVETRTQVDPEHVRLPDFVVVFAGNREKGALTRPPLIAIEVLSPTDSYKDLKRSAADLETMGVRNIWLIDPDARTGEVWERGSWRNGETTRLQAVDSPMFLDLDWLWQQMDE
jgi:Uma2 family endonuclease